ncbi:MAG: hypothetical protein GOU98_04110 [Candidatus Altiarchaeota archaeon]|nr:hypothetical protein [Candidatus Altiarchaeota archaeon]
MRLRLALLLFMITLPALAKLSWWDASWDYRVCLEVNTSNYSREYWPIEFSLNLTQEIQSTGAPGTINISSFRLIEQNTSSGAYLYEIESQFDPSYEFNSTDNFEGELVWIMNGTIPTFTIKTYCLYYDTDDKTPTNYENISYLWDGEEFLINVSIYYSGSYEGLEYYLDTSRGENISGIYRIRDADGNEFWTVPTETENPLEYTQYSNDTHNFTFDFQNNLTVKYAGSIRVVTDLVGPEVIWNTTDIQEGMMKKTYTFYNQSQWVKVEQEYTNLAAYNISRNSTNAGALAFEVAKIAFANIIIGNANEPGSWYWFAAEFANFHVGIINLFNSGNFATVNQNSSIGRGGIELSTTNLTQNETIYDVGYLHFNSPSWIRGSPTDAQVRNLRDRLVFPENTTKTLSEKWTVIIDALTDYSDFNKGENVTVFVNATTDSGLIDLVNATITSDGGVFETILYDDGTNGDQVADDDLYTNWFTVNVSNSTGLWNFSSYVWGELNQLLNTSNSSFNIQNTYTSNLTILNDYGFVDRTINSTLTLTNYRDDSFIGGATINCTYGQGVDAFENVTDYDNGTYFINFTAPSSFSIFDLVCNSTKLNNTGSGNDQFIAIEYTTSVTTVMNFAEGSGDNATLNNRYNFTMLSNITNLGNGTSYDTNITIYPPLLWWVNTSFSTASDLNLGYSDPLYFEISAPKNTTPGYYILNTTTRWRNSDNTLDEINNTFNISIEPNPVIEIIETLVNETVSPGNWNYLTNLSILSIGNYPFENLTFNVTGLENMTFNFTPSNISALNQGENVSVSVWAFVPDAQPLGESNGVLNASGFNTYDLTNISLNIFVTYLGIETIPTEFNSTLMRWYTFENFTLVLNTTNLGTTVAQATNLTIELPENNWTTNLTNNKYSCGDLQINEYCESAFNVGLMGSSPGTYIIRANVSWINPGVGVSYNVTDVSINVSSHQEFIVNQSFIANNATHGTSTVIGFYTLINTGNDQVTSMGTNVLNLPDFTFVFNPVISSLAAGNITDIDVNVTIPAGYIPGYYLGTNNVTSSGGGYDEVFLNVTIPTSKTWEHSPQNCTTPVAFDLGTMCGVFFNNTGNVPLNFSISPETSNYTFPNTTNFTIPKQTTYLIDFLWNITGVARDYYNATYNISVEGGTPSWDYFNLSMIPRELAEINTSFSVNLSQELETFTIYVNVTDKSAQGLNFSRIVVFKPNNGTEFINLNLISQFNVTYYYSTDYPTVGGISDVFGNYTFQIEIQDNLGLTSRVNITKYIYPLLEIPIETIYGTYFLGETVSLYVNSTDYAGTLISSNLSIFIHDPFGDLRYLEELSTPGKVEPIPTFSLASDAPIGNYTVFVNGTHYDGIANKTVYANATYQFKAREDYNIEFDTSLVWYPDSTMNFYVLTYGDRPFPPPEKINLTVYDPAQNIYFSTESFSQFDATNTSTLYTYSFAMPVNSPVGYYLAVLTLEEGGRQIKKLESFRVTYGGPFDVVILNIEPEVEVSTSQDFDILLENMGDFGQDVFVSYWVEKDNVKYDEVKGEAIFVAAGGNRTLNRSLNIFSNQLPGNYTLNVLLNYSTVSPPIEVSRTFNVIAATTEGEPLEILEPVQAAVIELTVTNLFPDQLILNRGSVGYLTIELKNTGNIDLTAITVFFEDIEKEWFEVVRDIDLLSAGSNGYLVVKFSIPDSASARTYVTKLRIIAKEIEVSEFYKILVFKTQEEALRARINTLQSELLDLEDQTGKVAARGGDVTKILSLLRKSRELLEVADTYLLEDSVVDAIKTISEAESVIEEIKYRLEIAKPDFLPTILLPQIPTKWYLILIFIAIIGLVAVIALKKFNVFKDKERRTSLLKIKNTLIRSREENEYSDVYDALKDQYEEGMISRETFEELKGLIK